MLRSLVVLLFLSSFSLYAQEEDLDDLFETPQDDIEVNEKPEVDLRSLFEESDKIKFSGEFYARGLIAGGWTNWDFFSDIKSGLSASAGLESSLKFKIDARPVPEFHFSGSVVTEFDPYASLQEAGETAAAEAVWTAPAFDELYADYILKDTLYTRIGKFSVSWGQGRFYTPGNLMKESSTSDFNIRLSLPSLAGLSFILLTNDSISYKDFTYGGKIDFVFGETMISPGITYNDSDAFRTLLSIKQVLFKTDFLIDFTTSINYMGLQTLYVVAGFYHEWDKIKLYGEYKYGRVGKINDHVASLAFGINKPFNAPFNFGIQWEQNLMDWSGSVTSVLTQTIFPLVKMTIGLPIVYGAEDSYAVVNNPDPEGRRIALGFSLELTGSF